MAQLVSGAREDLEDLSAWPGHPEGTALMVKTAKPAGMATRAATVLMATWAELVEMAWMDNSVSVVTMAWVATWAAMVWAAKLEETALRVNMPQMDEAFEVSLGGTAPCAERGGSKQISNENL